MGERVDINGHPTWVDSRGSGAETVLLLHGGLSDSDALLGGVGEALQSDYRIVAFDRRGHGFTADTDAPFHYDEMATEAIAVLEQVVGGPAHLVGWSDGGIVALLVARQRPELVARLVVIGANFHYDGVFEVAPDPAFLSLIMQAYAERSPDGAEHFGEVVGKFMTMSSTEPELSPGDVAAITAPTLVMVGDDDLISLSHTLALFEALPAGQLCVVPGASHALPIERPDDTARAVRDFLKSDVPPTTLMPIRRAGAMPPS